MNKIISKVFILLIMINLFGCSAENIYNIAINYERSKSDLERKEVKLDVGNIIYLENNIASESTIILLHGFGGDKDNWNKFSSELNGINHVIILDLPGHGESVSRNNLGYSITHQSQILNTFLEAKKINKIHIVGNSMGGAIALKFSGMNPEKVKSLTLIDALGMIKTKSEVTRLIEEKAVNPFFNLCTTEAFESMLHFGMEKPPYIPGFLMEHIVSKKCARSSIEKIVYKDFLKDADLTNVAENIKTPTLIIWGRKDKVLHVDNATLFHETIKNSKLAIFDELGHVPLLEDAEKTAGKFISFISAIK